ncbi:MAG: DUF4386 family protein [Dehalococcoidia bacterium]|nr:MAG: DUF4386 family protein [Dehalococcoidia bacterium]
MRQTGVAVHAADGNDRGELRLAGVAGLLVGLCYPIIIALYVMAGPDMPSDGGGQAWLDYISGHTTAWWTIIGLSVLTDILWLPFAWGLYRTLRRSNQTMALVGAGLMVLFVVSELTTIWPAYSVLTNLAGAASATDDDIARAARIAAAEYGAATLSSPLLPYYAIVLPAVGKVAIGIAMLRGEPFPRALGGVAIAIGVVDAISVVGSGVWDPLGLAVIPASLLSGVWFLVIGWLFVGVSRA